MTLTTASIPGWFKVYPANGKQLRTGAGLVGSGVVLGIAPALVIHGWFSDHPLMFLAAACLLLVSLLGIMMMVSALRGLPRLTIMPDGIKLEVITGTRWANWDSLDTFVITDYGQRMRAASAKVIGPHASKSVLRAKAFHVADQFAAPLDAIADDLNAARAHVAGITTEHLHD
jgi:hypothetical protein